MKNIIYLVIAIAVFCCNNNESTLAQNIRKYSVGEIKIESLALKKFTPDSSYLEYWCSISVLKETSDHIHELTSIKVAEFLASFNLECGNNVEYSEWSNELLFEVLKRKPEYFFYNIWKNNSLDYSLIKHELNNPVSDNINFDDIITKVKGAKGSKKIKDEVLHILLRLSKIS